MMSIFLKNCFVTYRTDFTFLEQDVKCQDDEHCEVQSQESLDGSWMPPIGVCLKNAMLADSAFGESIYV